MGNGSGGVSIGISANTQAAQRQIAGLNQGFGKLAQSAKSLFGGNNSQQLASYTKHLGQLERNLERVNARLKTLQGTQASLIQQQKQLQQSGGPGAQAQLTTLQKALHQNQRALSFWQAQQMGAQAAVGYQQGQAPRRAGGGGNGVLGFVGRGLWGAAAATGIGALYSGLRIGQDEERQLADLLPRLRQGRLAGSTTGALLGRVRGVGGPLGFSGKDTLPIAAAMSQVGGDFGRGLEGDTRTALQMARLFGIDATSQGSLLAEAGKMGGFVPGQAKRFAAMLAKEISITGLGPRAQEVQEATLALLNRQVGTTGTASTAATMAQQVLLAKTGIPGLQGANGANILSGVQSTIQGSTDDASIAFLEATARDQLGITGYYNIRRLKERGIQDPRLLPAMVQEAIKMSPHLDAAKDLLSRTTGLPLTMWDEIEKRTPGGLSTITPGNVAGIIKMLKGSGALDSPAAQTMGLTGNQLRRGTAARDNLSASITSPVNKGIGGLAEHGAHAAEALQGIWSDPKRSAGQKLSDTLGYLSTPGWKQGKRKSAPVGGYRIGPDGKATPYAPWERGRVPVLPPVSGGSAPAEGKSPKLERRSSADSLDINVRFDARGAMSPHVRQEIVAVVEDAMEEIQRRKVRGNLHHRYARN